MDNHIYKTIELTGTSANSIEEAVNRALARASNSIDNMRWFTVKEVRGQVKEGACTEWQVTIKASFTIKE